MLGHDSKGVIPAAESGPCTGSRSEDYSSGHGDSRVNDSLLQVIVAGLAGMGLGFNILPDREPRGEPSFNGGIHGFQSYPLAVAPPIIDRLIANLPMEA